MRAQHGLIALKITTIQAVKATQIVDTMVEAMGIEPMSESIFTGVSPSAAFVLKFRLKHRPKAGYIISYPVSPLCCRAFT